MLTNKAEKFGTVWPDVSRRAVATLRRRGVAPEAAEDAVHEAATRALAIGVAFEDADDLLRWINVVAWRVAVDARRRDIRLVYDVPEREALDNPAHVVELRVRLERLRELVTALPDNDREVLLRRTPSDMSRRESTRRAVRRHRVRARLLVLLEGAGAVLGWLRWRSDRHAAVRAAVLAVASPVIVLSLSSLLPTLREQGSDFPRPAAPRTVIPPPAVLAPAAAAVVAAARPRGPALPRVQAPREEPARDGVLPPFEIDAPDAAGGGGLWGRPKDPGDALLCADLAVAGPRCVSSPLRLTD